MNAPELLYGRRPAADVPLSDAALDLDARDAVVIENAEILYVLYEMRMSVAEALLPASLHPSVPSLLGITFVRAAGGPLGAFTAAWVGIACRTGIKPRHLVQSAFVDGDEAGDFLARRYGFGATRATVGHRETFDRVRGTVAVGGEAALDVSIVECIPLVGAGATIKYSPPLNAVSCDGRATMVQFEAAYEFKRVLRGQPRLARFDSAALGDPMLAPTTPIAGSQAVVDLHLMPARFEVDLEVPAEAGGARKLERSA